MKIALVVHDFDPHYGQGLYAVELARRLGPRHEVHVFANRFMSEWIPNVTYQKVPACRATALTTILSFQCSADRLLAGRHFDLTHAQGLTCSRAQVITAHICNAARRRKTPPGSLRARLFASIVCPRECHIYHNPSMQHVIAVSRQGASEITHEYGWKGPTSVIYHGTDAKRFRPPTSSEERETMRKGLGMGLQTWLWLFIGEAAKGLDLVIGELAAFPNASLLVVTRSGVLPFLGLAERIGVSHRVHFRGPETDVACAYRAADAFIYPSSYDTFGLVVAEAMASELPVIVGRGIGAAEWVVPGKNGLHCDPGNPASLHESLAWIGTHRVEAAQLGREARRTVEQYTWDACAAATEVVYQQVAAVTRRP